MGLGEVLKGIGWFVDDNGKPRNQPPPGPRNSFLSYFESALGKFTLHCSRWDKLGERERERALSQVKKSVQEWPEPVLRAAIEAGKEAIRGCREEGKA